MALGLQMEAKSDCSSEMPNAKRFGRLQPHRDFQSQPDPPAFSR